MAAATSVTIISDKYLNQMRLECDPLADDAVLAAVRYHGERVLKCHELYSTIKELGETFQDPSCSRFLEFYEHEPPWNVDWEKCDSGRRFFVRNSAIAGLVLMYCSLVLSFTAAFGNKVSLLKLCNSRGWGLLSCQIPRGGDEKRGQMSHPPSTLQHFLLFAELSIVPF